MDLETSPDRDVPCTLTIEQLIEQHYQVLYRYAFRLTGQQCDAEDLTQQCFLAAHRKLHQIRDATAARSWLYRILRTSFLRTCHKRTPRIEADIELPMHEVEAEQREDSPFDLEHLQRRLDELPETNRVALLMFYFEGKTYEEIAKETNVAMGTVMSRLSRAKAHLRNRLQSVEAGG